MDGLTHIFNGSKGLDTKLIGKKVLLYDEVTSTNDLAHRMAQDGEPEGVCIFARSQTSGRGRLGTDWVSPHGKGLYFSFILRPVLPADGACRITLTVAWAVARALGQAGVEQVTIKWPNDIFVDGKKACGILTEMCLKGARIDYLVVGVGVNVNSASHELPPSATSLKESAARDFDLDDLSHIMIREIDRAYVLYLDGGFPKILQGVKEASSLVLGARVRIHTQGALIEGYALDFDNDGGLIVRTDSGLVEKVLAGHLQVIA